MGGNGAETTRDELDLYSHWGRGGVGRQRKGNRVVAREGLRKRKTFSKWKWKENRGREVKEKAEGELRKRPPDSRENSRKFWKLRSGRRKLLLYRRHYY